MVISHALTTLKARAVLVIKDDDFGFEDDVLGVAEVDLAEAECIQHPRHPVTMAIKLMPGDSLGNAEDLKARAAAWSHPVFPVSSSAKLCMGASHTQMSRTVSEGETPAESPDHACRPAVDSRTRHERQIERDALDAMYVLSCTAWRQEEGG